MMPLRLLLLLLTLAALSYGQESETFTTQVKARFKAWDKNNDGVLSREEVDVLVSDARVRGKEAAAIAALKRAMRNTSYTLPSLTAEALTTLAAEKKPGKDKPDLNKLYTTALGRIAKADRELFPKDGPALANFHQGKLGNCFCLAAIGAMVCRDPRDVQKIITKTTNGYRVRLDHEWIPVAAPTDAERALLAITEPGGLWVQVYEKAVGKYRLKQLGRTGSYIDQLGKGGSAGSMVQVITGNEIVRFPCKLVRNAKTDAEKEVELNKARELLTKAFAEKRLVSCGTGAGVKVPSMHGNHAYAVTGYNRKKDEIALWNPHGQTFAPKGKPGLSNGYPVRQGRFTMPLSEFMEVFAGLAFETDKSTAKK